SLVRNKRVTRCFPSSFSGPWTTSAPILYLPTTLKRHRDHKTCNCYEESIGGNPTSVKPSCFPHFPPNVSERNLCLSYDRYLHRCSEKVEVSGEVLVSVNVMGRCFLWQVCLLLIRAHPSAGPPWSKEEGTDPMYAGCRTVCERRAYLVEVAEACGVTSRWPLTYTQ
ncbi:hypothetical protein INR49_025675, partial [Caranx melampygus]